MSNALPTALQPWLTVDRSADAVEWYKKAFGAVETYRFDGDEGSVVARLSVLGAQFWVGDESPEHFNFSPAQLGGSTVRLILVVEEPQVVFDAAIAAGAREIYPVADAYGWKVGRIEDPFGHHWEIGKEI